MNRIYGLKGLIEPHHPRPSMVMDAHVFFFVLHKSLFELTKCFIAGKKRALINWAT
jgi:hypothetical protein